MLCAHHIVLLQHVFHFTGKIVGIRSRWTSGGGFCFYILHIYYACIKYHDLRPCIHYERLLPIHLLSWDDLWLDASQFVVDSVHAVDCASDGIEKPHMAYTKTLTLKVLPIGMRYQKSMQFFQGKWPSEKSNWDITMLLGNPLLLSSSLPASFSYK